MAKVKQTLEKTAKELNDIEQLIKLGKATARTKTMLLARIEKLNVLRKSIFTMKSGRLDLHMKGEQNERLTRLDALIQLVFIAKATDLVRQLP